MNIINEKELRVFGLKRSGNHAIINWIMQQASGKVCFLNNCYPAGSKLRLYQGVGHISCKGIDYWDFKNKQFFWERNPFLGQSLVKYAKSDRRLNHDQLKNSHKDRLIISFEDRNIAEINRKLDKDHEQLVGESGQIFHIIILRDPFNHFASIYKKWGKDYLKIIVPPWENYAETFIYYEKNHLKIT